MRFLSNKSRLLLAAQCNVTRLKVSDPKLKLSVFQEVSLARDFDTK
jgi:hypothetical protein